MQPQNTTQPTFITLGKNAKDITGQRFGRLIALGPVEKLPNHIVVWLCRCDCGNLHHVRSANLNQHKVLSCGCLQSERAHDTFSTHGLSKHRLYDVWRSIVQRCTNPNNKGYKNYGGRGIAICDEWRHDFLAFYSYVSPLEYFGEQGYSLDRIDNNGHYEPGNVRWATRKEQLRNMRKNHTLSHNGKTQTVSAWAEELGVKRGKLQKRLNRGWPTDKVLSP